MTNNNIDEIARIASDLYEHEIAMGRYRVEAMKFVIETIFKSAKEKVDETSTLQMPQMWF